MNRQLRIDVTSVFAGLLASNRGIDPLDPDRVRAPDYTVSAGIEGSVLFVVLTFRAGIAYCCFEPSCHLSLPEGKRWLKLRQALTINGVTVPAQLTLRLSCIVEEGALSFDLSKPDQTRRGWYAFTSATNCQFDETAIEADACAG